MKVHSIVLPLMTGDAIDPLEPRMHAVCRDLIAEFTDQGHCDAINEFAGQYPIAIFGNRSAWRPTGWGIPQACRSLPPCAGGPGGVVVGDP